MKQFKRRPGVVLEEVCGAPLLIATRKAREGCAYVTQVNSAAAAYWRLAEGAHSVPELAEAAAALWGKETKETLLPSLIFVRKLREQGYLLEEESTL